MNPASDSTPADGFKVGDTITIASRPSRWRRLLIALGLAKPPEHLMVGVVSVFTAQSELPPGWELDAQTGDLSFDPERPA